MSLWAPPRLLDLAAMSLLRNEDLAMSALEFLPIELFPPLFMEAFYGSHSKTLKTMVHAWTFVRLPLGGLMELPHLITLQAVLDGLACPEGVPQDCRSRKSGRMIGAKEIEESEAVSLLKTKRARQQVMRCKLRVLDLRNTGQYFWSMWSGYIEHISSSSLTAPVPEDRSRTEQPLAPLEVFVEMSLKEWAMDEFLTYLMRWAGQKKDSIHLCCKKLKIFRMPVENIMKVLSVVQLDCIQDVEVNQNWHLSSLATFTPLLGQMSNVQRLILSVSEDQEQHAVVQFTSQFLKLHHLQDLCLVSPFFLSGHLDQMLRCLVSPLDNLAITHCLLTESDLTHLSQCPSISQLKGLDLSGITMADFSPELLQVLLEQVADTLQELDLNQCEIMDSHIEAILAALNNCSQLRPLSLCGNSLSMAAMEKLLRHTSGLPSLSHEFYPALLESYSSQAVLSKERLAQLRAELLEILRDLGHPRTIWLNTIFFASYGYDDYSHLEIIEYNPA
ncbi:PRAME family member 8-like [Muntiacus reevesi]|uniref:PRAME family member 8-like n=1 Tax=Muntiacus reevesi TaxID=9886 RepID=UPI003306F225